MKVVRPTEAQWVSGTDVVESMTASWREHLGPADDVAVAYKSYRQRSLCQDETTTRRFDEIHLLPGYADVTAAYHDTVEESLIVEGVSIIDGEGSFGPGDYFWRPPGWVHSARTDTGFTAIISLEGWSPTEGSRHASRVIRPLSELGTNAIPQEDRLREPRGRVIKRTLSDVIPGADVDVCTLPWDVANVAGLNVRVLSVNRDTGACSVVLDLAPGTIAVGRTLTGFGSQAYVLAGSCELAGLPLEGRDYAEIPAGTAAGDLTASEPARLFVKCNSV